MTEAPATEPETASGAEPDGASDGRRTWLMVGSLVVALVVVVGLTWVAGGFERRTDLRTAVAPGTELATGPYVFTFTAATVQKKKTFDDALVWEVVVDGTGKTTGDAAITPSTLDWFFSLREPVSDSVVEPESQRFGAADRSDGSFFTPGLAPIPYRLVFQLPAALQRPTDVQLAVWDLELRDRSLLKTGELSWGRADAYYRVDGLPVQQRPDDLD